MEEERDYTANSSSQSFSELVSNAGASTLSKIGDVARSGREVLDTSNNLMKLTFSTVGIIRSIRGIKSDESKPSKGMNEKKRYVAYSERLYKKDDNSNRELYNTNYDYIFRCGSYFLPLSFSFSVSGNTNIVKSQLVGGIQILENTFYEPQVIEIRIRMERRQWDANSGVDEMTFRQGQDYAVARLGDFLKYIRKDQPVFEVSNPYITKDLGIKYCTLTRYNIIPTEGSDITMINLTLMEVDLTTQTLFVN